MLRPRRRPPGRGDEGGDWIGAIHGRVRPVRGLFAVLQAPALARLPSARRAPGRGCDGPRAARPMRSYLVETGGPLPASPRLVVSRAGRDRRGLGHRRDFRFSPASRGPRMSSPRATVFVAGDPAGPSYDTLCAETPDLGRLDHGRDGRAAVAHLGAGVAPDRAARRAADLLHPAGGGRPPLAASGSCPGVCLRRSARHHRVAVITPRRTCTVRWAPGPTLLGVGGDLAQQSRTRCGYSWLFVASAEADALVGAPRLRQGPIRRLIVGAGPWLCPSLGAGAPWRWTCCPKGRGRLVPAASAPDAEGARNGALASTRAPRGCTTMVAADRRQCRHWPGWAGSCRGARGWGWSCSGGGALRGRACGRLARDGGGRGLPIDIVGGTSVGSAMAGAIALGVPAPRG